MATATLHAVKPIEPLRQSARINSVDILRGAVIVLMAIDHVRVYSGQPPGGPDPGIFFTRWITHFCAPVFVFLAGASAFLYGHRIDNKRKLAKFLLLRGVLLVVLELTLIRFFWTFNLNLNDFILAGVIWMLGWCMIAMAALIFLGHALVGILGLVIITFQDLFAQVPKLFEPSSQRAFGYFWEFIYPSGLEAPPGITILYVIVPWIGVMAAGYGFGRILLKPETQRRIICLTIGLFTIALFLVIGSSLVLARPVEENTSPFIFQLLNQRKYPASQLYILMTLGPAILLIPVIENAKGWFARVLQTFGQVPMFYYVMHILLIHISALIVLLIREGKIFSAWYANAPYSWVPEENRWPLSLLYFVFFIDIFLLYFLCKRYAQYKLTHPQVKWLKFL